MWTNKHHKIKFALLLVQEMCSNPSRQVAKPPKLLCSDLLLLTLWFSLQQHCSTSQNGSWILTTFTTDVGVIDVTPSTLTEQDFWTWNKAMAWNCVVPYLHIIELSLKRCDPETLNIVSNFTNMPSLVANLYLSGRSDAKTLTWHLLTQAYWKP